MIFDIALNIILSESNKGSQSKDENIWSS